MKKLSILIALVGVVGLIGAASAAENHGSVGVGHGVTLPSGDSNPCAGSTLMCNYDGTAENGFCWQYGGIVPPYYGAFAECYSGCNTVCGIELLLTGIGYPCGPCTLYLWADAGGMPGNVLCTTNGNNPCPVATWPSISTHDFAFCCENLPGSFWAGYWNDASAQPCGYFIAADLDGFGGCPFTNIAPGIGYPTGWNNASVVWGPTQALGICVWCGSCNGGTPTQESTWGQIKHLYN